MGCHLQGCRGGRALPAPRFPAPLATSRGGPAARSLFGPSLSSGVVGVSLISLGGFVWVRCDSPC